MFTPPKETVSKKHLKNGGVHVGVPFIPKNNGVKKYVPKMKPWQVEKMDQNLRSNSRWLHFDRQRHMFDPHPSPDLVSFSPGGQAGLLQRMLRGGVHGAVPGVRQVGRPGGRPGPPAHALLLLSSKLICLWVNKNPHGPHRKWNPIEKKEPKGNHPLN